MKILRAVPALLVFSGPSMMAAAVEAPVVVQRIESAATADEAYALFRARLTGDDRSGLPPEPLETAGGPEGWKWRQRYYTVLWDAGLAFIHKFPHDARRWDVLVTLQDRRVMGGEEALPPDIRAAVESVTPVPERDARRAEMARLVAALRASADASDRDRAYFDIWYGDAPTEKALAAIWADLAAKRAIDITPLNEVLQRVAEAHPNDDYCSPSLLEIMVGVLEQSGASREKMLTEIKPYLTQANAQLRVTAEALDRQVRLVGTAPQIAFTALDGREVDLAQWRGKVVLIDCWATWCGPCKAELPNIKNVYAAYHDKGLEVIGVTAETVPFSSKDSPDRRERKITAAKRKLAEFVAEEQLPWPQYFSELGFKNPIFQQFGVTGIPLLVLVDQDGKVVSIDARGPRLAAEVKRLLKL